MIDRSDIYTVRGHIQRVLSEARKPLTPREVADVLEEEGLAKYQTIRQEMARMARESQLERVHAGVYRLSSTPVESEAREKGRAQETEGGAGGESVSADTEEGYVRVHLPVAFVIRMGGRQVLRAGWYVDAPVDANVIDGDAALQVGGVETPVKVNLKNDSGRSH